MAQEAAHEHRGGCPATGWLFVGSDDHAAAAGHLLSLIASAPRLCEEVLRAWPEDRSQGTLVLRFRDKQGGATLAGGGWGGHDGALLIDDKHVNLNLPRVVAALLQAAPVPTAAAPPNHGVRWLRAVAHEVAR